VEPVSLVLNLAVAAFALTAIALTGLAGVGWRRSGQARMGGLTAGFGLFAVAGLVTAWWLFAREDLETLLTVHTAVTAAGLLVIYLAAVKR
jgi:hypothetical protein